MAMTVTLYKGVPVNGGSVATNKATLTEQLSYFNSFPSHVFNVNSVRLGDPIRLVKSIKELAGYTFGYIDYGDNFYYFFNVLDFTFMVSLRHLYIMSLPIPSRVTTPPLKLALTLTSS